MCGRYVVTSPLDVLRQRFGFSGDIPDYRPRYNLAPRQTAPTVTNREGRVVVMMTWGLVPAWTKELAKAPRPINARAETAPGLASFRGPFRRGRVLVGEPFWRPGAHRRAESRPHGCQPSLSPRHASLTARNARGPTGDDPLEGLGPHG